LKKIFQIYFDLTNNKSLDESAAKIYVRNFLLETSIIYNFELIFKLIQKEDEVGSSKFYLDFIFYALSQLKSLVTSK